MPFSRFLFLVPIIKKAQERKEKTGVNRDRLLQSIKDHEGYRDFPYRDSLGCWTVGYGHLLEDEILSEDIDTVAHVLDWVTSSDQHEQWLDDDMNEALESAQRFLGHAWNGLSEVRKEIITEMAFQLGYSRLCGFKKFHAAAMSKDWAKAAEEMLDSRWAQQTPNRAEALAERFLRDAET